MLPNLNLMLTILALGTPAIILVSFLPAIVELKKPKDPGPRMITETFPYAKPSLGYFYRLHDVEAEQNLPRPGFQRLALIMGFLPNLEA